MRKLLLIFLIVFATARFGYNQESHLSLIYDFEGEDFENSVKAMVGVNDSLYVICKTPNERGIMFRIDGEGNGYKVIWEFDDVNWAPQSLVANDTVIYGTTRFSSTGGGALFKYSLKDYTFEFLVDFDPFEVKKTYVKYITDSVLWMSSVESYNDFGSIFSIQKDGSDMKKVYNDTSEEKGQNPIDFVFYNDSIYIACYNGGGIPHESEGNVSSGSFIRIKSDGTGYENIIQGGDHVGTQPQSLIIREDKIIGLFEYSGSRSDVGGQFFRSNLDGSSLDSLGGLRRRAATKMFSTDSLIYGISFDQIFGVNPYNGETRIFENIIDEPSFGYDIVASPAFLNNVVYFSTQQGGPNRGGTILKWINRKPEVTEDESKSEQEVLEFLLEEMFVDPEGDSLTYQFKYDKDLVDLNISGGVLSLSLLESVKTEVKVTASDGWGGVTTKKIELSPVLSIFKNNKKKGDLIVYPNPVNFVLNLSLNGLDKLDIITLNGAVIKSFEKPGSSIDVNFLKNGVYLLRYQIEGRIYTKKIIKK